MCGIFGMSLSDWDANKFDVAAMIFSLGLDMETRGRDATGVLTVNAGGYIRNNKAPIEASRFFKGRPALGMDARLVLGHTRAATQGTFMDPLNNHPIKYDHIVGVHNGVIYNDNELYRDHKWPRLAGPNGVDSEAIFAALAAEPDRVKALEMVRGWMAIGWIDTRDPHRLWLAKGNSSPLHIAATESGSIVFASTEWALKNLVKDGLVPEWHFTEEIKQEGWIGSWKPGEDGGQPVWRETFKPAIYTYAGSQFSTGGARWRKGNDAWDYDWYGGHLRENVKTTSTKATSSKAPDSALRELAQKAGLPDPFPDEATFGIGDRVTNARGMVGVVIGLSDETDECIVDWDSSVEVFGDITLADETVEEVNQKMLDEFAWAQAAQTLELVTASQSTGE